MKTFRELDVYPRILLIVMLVMLLVFSVAYSLTISRVGFQYRGTVLVPEVQEDQTIYSGTVDEQKAVFTVMSDGKITYQWGDTTYGPYTLREDPTALPQNMPMGFQRKGVELSQGNQILLRGGFLEDMGGECWLFDANGTMHHLGFNTSAWSQYGYEVNQNGSPIDKEEPTALELLYLATGPEMTHNGSWSGWLEGASVCALVAATIFFADDMFYLRMSMRVQDAESVEPSDWELLSRKTGWTVGLLLAFLLFWNGMQ